MGDLQARNKDDIGKAMPDRNPDFLDRGPRHDRRPKLTTDAEVAQILAKFVEEVMDRPAT
jgi:hypothetical protein